MFKTNFEKNLDIATSHLHLEPDWPTIMSICDEINQKDVTPKFAFSAIKKKMISQNPHSACYALLVLESVVKNCGTPVHEEIFTKENCEMFSLFLEQTPHENVRQKMLELVQTWANAFRSSEKYQAIKDTMTILKTKGHSFPEVKEADAMFTADTAPDWADGKDCHRCRKEFGVLVRKHHCRNCGQIFCGDCTAKQCSLPKYGIEKEVRVCDLCYTALQRPKAKQAPRVVDSELPAEYLNSSLAQQVQTPQRKTEQELKEEEELQLAIALSQSEAEQKRHQPQLQHQTFNTTAYRVQQRSPSPEPTTIQPEETANADLAKYLNRNYWEQRKVTESPTASPSAPSPMPTPQPQTIPLQQKPADEAEIDVFAANMRTKMEIFVNRMKSNSSRGRSNANDTFVQTLFLTLTSLHSQQLSYIKEMDDKRMWYEQLQDKLVQIKDSRAALDVLRQEHIEKLNRLAEEQELQRQIQMAQKLEIMRKKKQEYLQYTRQLALQKIQKQEREMQMRQEQQKVQYLMGQSAFPFMPPGSVNATGVHGSPSHQLNNVYNAYGYNPNSPGPMNSGQFNAQQQLVNPMPVGSGMSGTNATGPASLPGGTGPTPLPGMYTGNMPTMLPNPNQHAGMLMTSMPGMGGGMLPTNGNMMTSGAVNMPMLNDNRFPNQANSLSQGLLQTHQQQQPQQTQYQQNAMAGATVQQPNLQQPNPQLSHIMLQHQNVIQNQPPIPTPNHMPAAPGAPAAPTAVVNNAPPQTNITEAQVQAISAAPAPPQNEPEPVVAATPEEPATAELISFD